MQVKLNLELGTVFYQTEGTRQAEQLAKETSQTIYCWKASGRPNWLERAILQKNQSFVTECPVSSFALCSYLDQLTLAPIVLTLEPSIDVLYYRIIERKA